jgi:hypothetical protein
MLFWLSTSKHSLSLSLALPQKIYKYILCTLQSKNSSFFSSSGHDAEVYTEEARESTGILYFIYDYIFWVSRVPLNVVESAFYRAKTVIVLKVGFKIDERYQKFHSKGESGK